MKSNIIYLMGAGRSGTTALATFLGNNENVLTVGEMHQFFEHIEKHKNCSCGEPINDCPIWSNVLKNLPVEFIKNANEYKNFCEQFEYHNSIFKYAFKKFSTSDINKYLEVNETIFAAISADNKQKYFLDSAKYIGRVLGLNKSEKLNVKIIYVVRDVRGVINSFLKKVQSPRNPINTIIYYLVINMIAEIVYRILSKDKVIKLKYESLMEDPIDEFMRLEKFLELDLSDIKHKIENNESFEMSHIIGGNRLKNNKEIYFKKDNSWQEKFSSYKSISYYILASPIMLLNRFKV